MGGILYRRGAVFLSVSESPPNTVPTLPCCPHPLLARGPIGRGTNQLPLTLPIEFWTQNWRQGRALMLCLAVSV